MPRSTGTWIYSTLIVTVRLICIARHQLFARDYTIRWVNQMLEWRYFVSELSAVLCDLIYWMPRSVFSHPTSSIRHNSKLFLCKNKINDNCVYWYRKALDTSLSFHLPKNIWTLDLLGLLPSQRMFILPEYLIYKASGFLHFSRYKLWRIDWTGIVRNLQFPFTFGNGLS